MNYWNLVSHLAYRQLSSWIRSISGADWVTWYTKHIFVKSHRANIYAHISSFQQVSTPSRRIWRSARQQAPAADPGPGGWGMICLWLLTYGSSQNPKHWLMFMIILMYLWSTIRTSSWFQLYYFLRNLTHERPFKSAPLQSQLSFFIYKVTSVLQFFISKSCNLGKV